MKTPSFRRSRTPGKKSWAWSPTWSRTTWPTPTLIAVAASQEFGVPLMDLAALEIDLDVIKAVDQRLVTKHRVLPLLLRGKRLYLGVSDPTNLLAIDEIKFQTGFRVEPVVVEQDKMEEMVTRALDAVDTSMSNFDEDGLRSGKPGNLQRRRRTRRRSGT